jgi:hypothetical protein
MILKILIGVILIFGVGNVIQYVTGKMAATSYEKKITELENQNTELKVTEEKQKGEIERLKKKKEIKARVSHEQEKVEETVLDNDAVIDFFRVRRKGKVPDTPDGGKSSTGLPTRRKAVP